jgi:hypothetical protein
MIISASYKTDIPTFYGDWFLNRLEAGYCKVVNPYNGRPSVVSLQRQDVDGIVFWTKNIGPFMQGLETVRGRGFPFVVQYTINGYPRELESRVVDARKSVEHAHKINGDFGPRVLVWRYDTIVLSTITDEDFHIRNFERLASGLAGTTDEVVVSFVHMYEKTRRNIQRSGSERGYQLLADDNERQLRLLANLVDTARSFGMRLTVCSQPENLVAGAGEARCVDARRLEDVAGASIDVPIKGNRKTCGCFESRDIGEYDTCPHGCVYCYAVRNDEAAKARYAAHDPRDEFLMRPERLRGDVGRSMTTLQLPIFHGD